MPSDPQHQNKSQHNRSFLASLDLPQFPDWGTVAAFYTAVHLVERLRTKMSNPLQRRSKHHGDRLLFVQRHHPTIHTEYHQLYNASLLARYEDMSAFSHQFSLADVQDTLINTYLVAIEAHVSAQFAILPLSPPTAGG